MEKKKTESIVGGKCGCTLTEETFLKVAHRVSSGETFKEGFEPDEHEKGRILGTEGFLSPVA